MLVRALISNDAESFQRLRLEALSDSPLAFASSYEEECDRPISEVRDRLLANDQGSVFGAFDRAGLVAMMGVKRERHRKLRHKAYLWGVYVAPSYRNQGIGRQLLSETLGYAFEKMCVRQITLGVGTWNTAAIALYESLGFERFGTEPSCLCVEGLFYDELYMVCRRDSIAESS